MSIVLAKPAEAVDVKATKSVADYAAVTLIKTGELEVARHYLAGGSASGEHAAPGSMTIHCVEGRVRLHYLNETHELAAGQLAHLPGGARHSLSAAEDSLLLFTIALPQLRPQSSPLDVVQEASEESFPASDAPSYSPITWP